MNRKMPKFMQRILKKIKKFRKNRKSNRNAFLIFAAVVMIWCGVANLIETYFFPNKPLVRSSICMIFWLIILLLDDGKLWELEWEWELKEEIKEEIKKETKSKI